MSQEIRVTVLPAKDDTVDYSVYREYRCDEMYDLITDCGCALAALLREIGELINYDYNKKLEKRE